MSDTQTQFTKPYILHIVRAATPQKIEVVELDEHPTLDQLYDWIDGDTGDRMFERVNVAYSSAPLLPSMFQQPGIGRRLGPYITDMIIHESGLLYDLPINWLATGLYAGTALFGPISTPICGDVVIFARGRLD